MKNWVVQYIYETEKNEQGVSIIHITAETLEEAKEIAQQKAVAKDYIFNVYPQSDEQFLGTVKYDAKLMAGDVDIIDMAED